MRKKHVMKSGFSLLEVVIVVAIVAILAAIGIPRMSRGSKGAGDSALKANLSVLRNAIDLYSAEHQGDYPAVATFSDQLTQYSDASGNTNASKTTSYIYGPYIRSIPVVPVGPNKGKNGVSADGSDPNDGWVYTAASGTIVANTGTDKDDADVLYSDY